MNSRLRGSFFYLHSPLWGKDNTWKLADFDVSEDYRLLWWKHKVSPTLL